jgi:hypothetical protein
MSDLISLPGPQSTSSGKSGMTGAGMR